MQDDSWNMNGEHGTEKNGKNVSKEDTNIEERMGNNRQDGILNEQAGNDNTSKQKVDQGEEQQISINLLSPEEEKQRRNRKSFYGEMPKPSKKRPGLYILIAINTILLVIIIFLVLLLIGVMTTSYSSSSYNTTQSEEKMPAVQAVPAGGREVPAFGSAEQSYDFPEDGVPAIEITKKASDSVVGIITKTSEDGELEVSGSGSGIVLSENGYIITNKHVISNADRIYVMLAEQEEEIPAELIGYDEQRDIAVIKIVHKQVTPPIFGDSEQVQTGEMAIAIGNPLGTLTGTITQGIISAKNRVVTLSDGHRQAFIQTDTAINPGNSGGALLNGKGQVIGINTWKTTTITFDERGLPVTAEGLGFAIPINDALDIAEQLIATGEYKRVKLGITLKQEEDQVVIEEIEINGLAYEAGLRKGDRIRTVNGTAIETLYDMNEWISEREFGDEATISVERNGQILTYVITL